MAQGPCHTPEKVWYKRPCHTMAQVPCHTPQRPSQSQLLYPVPYLRNPVPYPYHTLATLTSAEHILFPHANHTRAIPQGVQEQSRQDSPAPEATTNPSKQQTAGETVKPGAGQDSPGAEQDSRGAVPYLSICAGMEQAPVPYSGTRPVPYPPQGMVQAFVPYYGTAACQRSSPGKRNKNSLPYKHGFKTTLLKKDRNP